MTEGQSPAETLAQATRAVAGADDVAAQLAAAAEGFESLAGRPAAVAVYGRETADTHSLVAATGDWEGVVGAAPPETLASDHPWRPEDATALAAVDAGLVVPVADGAVVVAGVDPSEAPAWAVETLAASTYAAAVPTDRAAALAGDVAELEAENEQLRDFASIVAHDLRNPLTVAQGHIEFAADTGNEEHFEKVEDALDRIENIIDHTLSMAKEDSRSTEAVDLETALRRAWDTVATRDATLDVAATTTVDADPDRLQQLFENLLRNAVEHGGSAVTVRLGLLDAAGEPTTDESAAAGFHLEDDGRGIPEERRDEVFERGVSEQAGGTGLGLSIVADVAEEHGWEVGVTEGTDGGARFTFVGI